MKYLLLTFLALYSTFANANPNETKTKAITLHPFSSFLVSGFSVTYERGLGTNQSLEIPLHLGVNSYADQSPLFILGSGISSRYYLSSKNDGGYLSPTFEFVYIHRLQGSEEDGAGNLRNEEKTASGMMTLTWVRYGYKWQFPFFVLDAGLGAGWLQNFDFKGNDENVVPNYNGLIPMGHFALGIPF